MAKKKSRNFKKPAIKNNDKAKKNKVEQASPSTIVKWFSKDFNTMELALITAFVALFYFSYSYLSSGMLQGEEGVQYMNMKKFWHRPNAILGNWAKPGWKIFYVIPALGGFKFLMLYNSLISALSGLMAYKVAKHLNLKFPIVAMILLMSQFLWVELSFRNYSELISSLFLISAIYFHFKERFFLAALFLGYCLIVRQEMAPIILLYFGYLVYKKQWVAILGMGVFPLFINCWGWASSGDPLYLLNQALGASQSFLDQYPRQGFDHYFNVATPIYGTLCLVGLIAYLILVVTKKRKLDYFIFIPAIIFFIFHSLFQWQSVKFGTSTGGNWRYMLTISPLLAVLATIGWEKGKEVKNKIPIGIALALFLIFAYKVTGFEHNYVLFKEAIDLMLPGMVLLTSIFYLIPKSNTINLLGLSALMIVFNILYLKPIQMPDGENKAIKEFIPWAKEANLDQNPIFGTNAMVLFFWDRNEQDFPNGYNRIDKENVEAAPVGSHMFWDSHYTKRRYDLDYSYFTEKPDKYQLIKEVRAGDNTFVLLVFRKIAM